MKVKHPRWACTIFLTPDHERAGNSTSEYALTPSQCDLQRSFKGHLNVKSYPLYSRLISRPVVDLKAVDLYIFWVADHDADVRSSLARLCQGQIKVKHPRWACTIFLTPDHERAGNSMSEYALSSECRFMLCFPLELPGRRRYAVITSTWKSVTMQGFRPPVSTIGQQAGP